MGFGRGDDCFLGVDGVLRGVFYNMTKWLFCVNVDFWGIMDFFLFNETPKGVEYVC